MTDSAEHAPGGRDHAEHGGIDPLAPLEAAVTALESPDLPLDEAAIQANAAASLAADAAAALEAEARLAARDDVAQTAFL